MKRKRSACLLWLTCFLYLAINESFASQTSSEAVENNSIRGKEVLARIAKRRMHDLFNWMQGLLSNDDGSSFVGRCFKGLRRLGMMANIVVFKLGIVLTILAFLAVFNMKTLWMVGIVILMNVASFAFKLGLAKHDHHQSPIYVEPPRVHYNADHDDFYQHAGHVMFEDRSSRMKLKREDALRSKIMESLAEKRRLREEKIYEEHLRLKKLYLDNMKNALGINTPENRRRDIAYETEFPLNSSILGDSNVSDIGSSRIRELLYLSNQMTHAPVEEDSNFQQDEASVDDLRTLDEQLALRDLYRRLGYPDGLPL